MPRSRPCFSMHSTLLRVTPQWTVTKSTPSSPFSSMARKRSSAVISTMALPALTAATAAW